MLTIDTAPTDYNAWTDGTRFAIARAAETEIDVYVGSQLTESAMIDASRSSATDIASSRGATTSTTTRRARSR